MAVDLWVEKYRPSSVEEFVFRDEKQKSQCKKWIEKDKTLPHLFLSGNSGVGKSALVGVLLKELKVPEADILKLNASKDNSVENIRNNVCSFASITPYGEMKYVWLDEADYLSPSAQATLRGVTEEYTDITRFIFTCNYPHKVIPAIKGRCQCFHIESLDKDAYFMRVLEILVNEDIDQDTIDRDIIDRYIDVTYPNMRATINLLQMNFDNNVLPPLDEESLTNDSDLKMIAVALFKDGKIQEARKAIVKDFRAEENEDWFRLFYDNLDWWGDTPKQQAKAIVKIRDGLVKSTMCADLEINIAATLVELEQIAKE